MNPGSGVPRSAVASDVPSFGAEVADLSVDAKNTVIASDRTGGDEQRHGPVDGGSSASEDPEIKGRNILAAARGAAAMIGRIPKARRSRGGSDRQSSGLSPVATRSGGGSSRQTEAAGLEAVSKNDGVGKGGQSGAALEGSEAVGVRRRSKQDRRRWLRRA